MVDLTFLRIQILNRPQIHKIFPLFLTLCTGQEEENGIRIFDDESCGDAQDLSSPMKKMSLRNQTLMVWLLSEIASLL